jgi:hypothetical protein
MIPVVIVVLVAILCPVILCRRQIAHKKRASVGTLLTGAFCAAVISDILIVFVEAGLAGFTRNYWAQQKLGGGIPYLYFFICWIFTLIPCVLVALGVMIYYQRRSKSDETRVA